MFLQKKQVSRFVIFWFFLLALGCGVKGDPLPPEKPANIGRGRPTYKRATEEIKIQKNTNRKTTPVKDESENEDDERE